MKLIVSDHATTQALDAADWYDERSPGTGSRFVLAIEQTYRTIGRQTFLYMQVEPDVRRIKIEGFPYYVYYRHRGERLEVVAVVHTARHPVAWRESG